MRTCLACHRRIPPRLERCQYCGGPAESADLARPPLACPGCHGPMEPAEGGGQVLDRCTACGGTWFDRGELEAVLHQSWPTSPAGVGTAARVGQAAGAATPTGLRACPVCVQPMTPTRHARGLPVVLDRCGHHGVFLDGGELERLVAWQAGSESQRPRTAVADPFAVPRRPSPEAWDEVDPGLWGVLDGILS